MQSEETSLHVSFNYPQTNSRKKKTVKNKQVQINIQISEWLRQYLASLRSSRITGYDMGWHDSGILRSRQNVRRSNSNPMNKRDGGNLVNWS